MVLQKVYFISIYFATAEYIRRKYLWYTLVCFIRNKEKKCMTLHSLVNGWQNKQSNFLRGCQRGQIFHFICAQSFNWMFTMMKFKRNTQFWFQYHCVSTKCLFQLSFKEENVVFSGDLFLLKTLFVGIHSKSSNEMVLTSFQDLYLKWKQEKLIVFHTMHKVKRESIIMHRHAVLMIICSLQWYYCSWGSTQGNNVQN